MEDSSVEKIVFRNSFGHWEFVVMLFGLCSAPASLQRLMNQIFVEELNSFVFCYMNNIFIFSHSVEEHWGHLKRALQRLRDVKLYGRLQKCDFVKYRVDYLGSETSSEEIHASPES